jgi:ribosomal protein S18 acetylase RimI-like enzyme
MTLHKPPISAETTPQLRQYPRETTVSTFRALYDDAFHAHPWYQPWLSDDEVRDDLQADDSILFWEHEGAPVGFVWVRRPKRYVADLEPVGVIPAYQGQGFGRKLLAASLDFLAREGIGKVRLGVWSENQRAIALYQSFGFRQTGSHYYLVREIGGE